MKFQCSIRFHGLSPIRNISYLLPMCCSFWEKCINSQKNGLGCSTPLNTNLLFFSATAFLLVFLIGWIRQCLISTSRFLTMQPGLAVVFFSCLSSCLLFCRIHKELIRCSWFLPKQIIPNLVLSRTTVVLLLKRLLRLYMSRTNLTIFEKILFRYPA